MRSVVVVFPASMCAMMPMFRVLSSGVVRGMRAPGAGPGLLPPVMGERLVGVGHAVGVFLLLHCLPALVGGVDQLVGELLRHAATATRARVLHEPAHRERRGALGPYLDRPPVVPA